MSTHLSEGLVLQYKGTYSLHCDLRAMLLGPRNEHIACASEDREGLPIDNLPFEIKVR